REAGLRQPIDLKVDFLFRTDVDASRRLVQKKNSRLGQQAPGKYYLLLVASGKRSHRPGQRVRLDAQPFKEGSAHGEFTSLVRDETAGNASQGRHRHVAQ